MKSLTRLLLSSLAISCCSIVSARAETSLLVGDVAPISPSWPSFVAVEKDFFKSQDLNATITYAGSAANAVQQLVAGAFDIAIAPFDSAVRAASAGAKVKVIGATTVKYPYSVMVGADIKSPADLRGKSIILSFQKDITTTLWNQWVTKQGVDPASIDQVYDGASPNRYAALNAHRVQAAFLGSPFDFKAKQDGAHALIDYASQDNGFPFTVVIVRSDWLDDHQDVAKKFLAAISKSEQWLNDKANRQDAAAILSKATKQDPALSLETYDYFVDRAHIFSPDLRFPETAGNVVGEMLTSLGDLKSASAVPKDLVDLSLLPH